MDTLLDYRESFIPDIDWNKLTECKICNWNYEYTRKSNKEAGICLDCLKSIETNKCIRCNNDATSDDIICMWHKKQEQLEKNVIITGV